VSELQATDFYCPKVSQILNQVTISLGEFLKYNGNSKPLHQQYFTAISICSSLRHETEHSEIRRLPEAKRMVAIVPLKEAIVREQFKLSK